MTYAVHILNAKLRRFVDANTVGVLATSSLDGRPRQSLVYFTRVDDRLLISTLSDRLKSQDVRRSGWASLCVMGHEPPYSSATFGGSAEILTENIGAPTATIMQRITRAAEPPEPMSDEALAEVGRVILAITVERVTAANYIDDRASARVRPPRTLLPVRRIDRPLPASVAPQGVESRKSRDDRSPRGPASSGDESATRGAPLMSNQRVIDEIRATLERDPRINHAAQVAVSEQAGQVTLRGTVRSLHQHRVALEIAKSVQGVNAVTDGLRVDPRDHALDDQIRGAALQALMSNDEVPDGRIDVRVADGWLTLTGEVKHQRESTVAFETVSNVAGVGGITNKITVITAGMDG